MKKLITILLLASMLLSGVSCSETTDSGKQSRENTPVQSDGTSNADETDDQYYNHIEARNLGGIDFRIISRMTQTGHNVQQFTDFGFFEFAAEEMDGTQINDAVYERNDELQERFNFHIVSLQPDMNPMATARTSIMANSDDYDMIADGLSYMLDYSMFRDLTNLDYIDLTMPCWDQNANAGLSIANKHFVVTGDLLIHDKRGTWSQLFNKTLSSNLQLENHYDLVREGKWTIDKYHENASLASNDTNGNGKMDEADTWGYLGEYYNFGIMMIGAGTHFTTKDEKDYPVLDMYSEHTVAAFEKVYDMLIDKNICLSMDWAQGGASATLTAFSEDRGLYYMTSIATASEYRYMDSDFGIIPIPKYDEAQENYYTSFSAGNSGAVAMPITVGDPDDKAFIMHAMCLASTDTLQVAFYDVVLTGVTARDEESGEMLDILFANRVYDLGFVQNWGGMRDLYSSLVKSGKKELASAYKRKEKTIIKAIDEAYETYQALE